VASLGSGTPWGSGDETDYVLRALAAGFTLGYDPSIVVYHESPNPQFGRAAAARAYGYGMGNSRVLRMHGYSRRFAAYRVLQVGAGSAYFLVRGRFGLARFYLAMARGRAVGWFKAK
jgi:GT2 family glycosyltransferase